MLFSTLLMLHVIAAVFSLLAGYLAIVLRKGSGLHRAAGSVFFVSMLCMTSSAAVMSAFLSPNALNVVVALFTFYLVTTAWHAARRHDVGVGAFGLAAFLFVAAVGASSVTIGIQALADLSGTRDGMPPFIYFVFGTAALLCATTDARMLLRRSPVGGTERLRRHLWRMSLALLIATLSLYPGQARLFPLWLRETNLLFIPHLLLVGSMLFWMVRYRRARSKMRIGSPGSEYLGTIGSVRQVSATRESTRPLRSLPTSTS
jgi:uncharacterized membrane protein